MARSNSLDNRLYDKEDIGSLAEGKTNAEDLIKNKRDITKTVSDIRQRLEIAENESVLSREEQNRIQEQLYQLDKEKDGEKLMELRQEIDAHIDVTRNYFSKLEQNGELYGIESKGNPKRGRLEQDPLRNRRQEFQGLNLEAKKQRLLEIDREVDQLRKERDKLIQLVGKSPAHLKNWAEKNLQDKESYMKELEKNLKDFNDLLKQGVKNEVFEKEDIESELIMFREKPVEWQKQAIREMKDKVSGKNAKESTLQAKKDFKEFSKVRQDKYKNEWDNAKNPEAKTAVIEKMKDELKKELEQKNTRCPYYSQKEINENVRFIRQSQLRGKKNGERSIAETEKDLDDFEKFLEPLKQFAQEYEKNIDEIKGMNNGIFKAAADSIVGKMKFWEQNFEGKERIAKKEMPMHLKLIKQWMQDVDKYEKEGLICSTSAAEYRKSFAKMDLDEKRKVLQGPNVLKGKYLERRKSRDDFKKLTDEKENGKLGAHLKKKYGYFESLRLEDRIQLVKKMKEEVEQIEEGRGQLKKTIKEKIEKRLLSPKSKKAYEDWVESLVDAKEVQKFAAHSDLDDPSREIILEKFEGLPKGVKDENKEFYDLDLSGRKSMLLKLLPEDQGKELMGEINHKTEATEQAKKLENAVKLDLLTKNADEFQKSGNLQAEIHEREQITEIDPENADNNERMEEIDQMMQQEVESFDIFTAIQLHPEMKRSLLKTIYFGAHAKAIEKHELESGTQTFESRSEKGMSEEWQALQGQLYQQENMVLNKETGEAEEVEEIDMINYKTITEGEMSSKVKKFKDEELPALTRTTQTARNYRLRDEKGEEMKGTKLRSIHEQMEGQSAAQILDMLEKDNVVQFRSAADKEKAKKKMSQRLDDEGFELIRRAA